MRASCGIFVCCGFKLFFRLFCFLIVILFLCLPKSSRFVYADCAEHCLGEIFSIRNAAMESYGVQVPQYLY